MVVLVESHCAAGAQGSLDREESEEDGGRCKVELHLDFE